MNHGVVNLRADPLPSKEGPWMRDPCSTLSQHIVNMEGIRKASFWISHKGVCFPNGQSLHYNHLCKSLRQSQDESRDRLDREELS